MDKRIYSILLIFIIIAIVGICGCITIKEVDYEQYLKDSSFYRPSITPTPTVSEQESPVEVQLTEILPNKGGILLKESINKLDIYNAEGLINADNLTYYQVLGTGVGIGGRADSWLFGVRQDGTPLLFSYEDATWINMRWPGPLSEEEINLDNIISPEDLFNKNRELITQRYMEANVSYADLFLKDGVYTIAIRDGETITELKFKSDTGELV